MRSTVSGAVSRKAKLRIMIKIFLGLTILAVLASKLSFNRIWTALHSVSPVWYLIAVAMLLPYCFIKFYRWRVLTNWLGIRVRLVSLFIIYLKGFFYGLVTPGRLGEMGKAWLLPQENEGRYKSLASVFLDRFFDVIILIPICLIGAAAYRESLHLSLSKVIYMFVFFILASFILVLLLYYRKSLNLPLSKRFLGKYKERVILLFQAILSIDRSTFVLATVLSLTAQLFWGGIGYVLMTALDLEGSFWWLVWCMSFAAIISYIPITFAGLGLRESSMAFFFILQGHDASMGVSFGLMLSSMLLWLSLFGFISLFIETASVELMKW
jgi:uncharacterized protein (TIRG00374 family)